MRVRMLETGSDLSAALPCLAELVPASESWDRVLEITSRRWLSTP